MIPSGAVAETVISCCGTVASEMFMLNVKKQTVLSVLTVITVIWQNQFIRSYNNRLI
jgi:hypothetical protein